jgi:Flp pilus assembly protein TadG
MTKPNQIKMLNPELGSLMIEFALILPVFLILALGTIEASLIMYNKSIITHAARIGARSGVVLKSPTLTVSQTSDLASVSALTYANNNLISLGSTIQSPTATVDIGSTTISFGTPVKVTVTYTYTGLYLKSVLGFANDGVLLQSSAIMYHE